MNSFISSGYFLVKSLRFSIHRIISSVHRAGFLSFFLIWMPFISFSCLIAVVQICKTMLNRSSESGHPYLAIKFREKAFSFSPLSMMLAVGFL